MQEHVTEYGVHWNFFFTLGLLPLFGHLAEKAAPVLSFRTAGLLCTVRTFEVGLSGKPVVTMFLVVHQTLLAATPLQYWIFSTDRSNLISANKEGLVSMLGYAATYLLGCHTGTYALPPDPAWLERKRDKPYTGVVKIGKLLNMLFSYSAVWWSAFACIHFLGPDQLAVSRRMVRSTRLLQYGFLCSHSFAGEHSLCPLDRCL